MTRPLKPGEQPRALPRDIEERLDKETREYYERLQEWDGLPLAQLPFEGEPKQEAQVAELNDLVAAITEAANPTPSFIENPRNMTTEITDAEGRVFLRETDSKGNVRTTTLDDGEAVKLHREIIDERYAAHDKIDLAKTRRSLATDARNQGAFGVADALDEEANALQAEGQGKLDELRAMVDPEDWESLELGKAPPRLAEGVAEVVQMVKDGQVDAAVDAYLSLGKQAQYQVQMETGGAAADLIAKALDEKLEAGG
jgi:hypothetical protein